MYALNYARRCKLYLELLLLQQVVRALSLGAISSKVRLAHVTFSWMTVAGALEVIR